MTFSRNSIFIISWPHFYVSCKSKAGLLVPRASFFSHENITCVKHRGVVFSAACDQLAPLTCGYSKVTRQRKLQAQKAKGVRVGYNNYSPNLLNIFSELKYRALYAIIALGILLGLIYLNLGLYIEFQGSYYLNYYQFTDFNWCEGMKELNDSYGRPIKLAEKSQTVVSLHLGLESNDSATPILDSDLCSRSLKTETSPNLTSHLIPLESRPSTILANYFLLESIDSKNERLQTVLTSNLSSKNTASTILVEIEEYKPFFISTLSYFAGQVKFFIGVIGPVNPFSEKEKLGSIYFISIFYQLINILGYHLFGFLGPGMLKRSRLKIWNWLITIYLTLLIHFLMLPSFLSIWSELQIEGLDSELFYGVDFDLVGSGIHCFYGLLFFALLFSFIFGMINQWLKPK